MKEMTSSRISGLDLGRLPCQHHAKVDRKIPPVAARDFGARPDCLPAWHERLVQREDPAAVLHRVRWQLRMTTGGLACSGGRRRAPTNRAVVAASSRLTVHRLLNARAERSGEVGTST